MKKFHLQIANLDFHTQLPNFHLALKPNSTNDKITTAVASRSVNQISTITNPNTNSYKNDKNHNNNINNNNY